MIAADYPIINEGSMHQTPTNPVTTIAVVYIDRQLSINRPTDLSGQHEGAKRTWQRLVLPMAVKAGLVAGGALAG